MKRVIFALAILVCLPCTSWAQYYTDECYTDDLLTSCGTNFHKQNNSYQDGDVACGSNTSSRRRSTSTSVSLA